MEELQDDDPRQVGKYTLLGRLGSGGMGQVFLGRSLAGRLVAVKIIHPELARDQSFRRRFAREIEAARRVSGVFTAPVIDADPDARLPWLVTGYVNGPSLANAVEEHGPLPVSSVLTLAAGLAEGLGAVHQAGVIHRDLKPSNVLLAQDGPRLIDFGISHAADFSHVTLVGSVIGTPGFMSPEQALGDPVGTPSDIFSLGTVLAFAATGEGPYGTGSPAARQLRVLNDMPRLDQVPAELRPLVERCMAREPAERPSADQFLAELVAMHPAAANQTDWPPSALLGMAAAQPATPPVEAVAAPAPVTRAPVTPAPVTRAPADPAAPPEWSPTMTAAPPRPAPSEHAAADKAADPPKPKLSAAAGTPSRRRYRWAAMAAIVAALVGVAGLAVAFPLLARSSQHGQLWAGDVDSKLTAVSDSYWLKVGTAWQDYWVFYPRCTSGACGLDLDGGLYGEPFTAQLLWDGSAYTGSVEIDDYWSCVRAGNYANATLHIQVAGVPAGVPGGVWTITSFTGTLVWSVAYDPNGGCAAETYSWQAQST